MTTATVMWDLDGVATDWVGNFYPWLCAKMGWEQSEWKIWHHYRNHGMSDEDFVKCLGEYAEQGGFGTQRLIDGVQKAVRRLQEAGCSQHVVTDRPDAARADTAWWIDTYIPETDTLTVSRDKTVFMSYDDGPYFAIDDRVENVQTMTDAGVNAFLLTRPWNEHSNLPRVADLEEFVDEVLASVGDGLLVGS